MDATLTVDTSPFSQIDRRFFAVLFGSLLLHAVAATWVARQPRVAETESYDVAPVDRFLKAPLLPIPKLPPLVKVVPPQAGQTPKAPAPRAPRPTGPGPAARPGLLGMAFGEVGEREDVRAALDGAAGPVDTSLLAVPRREGAQRSPQTIMLNTDGAKAVVLGEHTDAPARQGRVEDLVLEDTPELPNPQLLMQFIHARRSALVACYEAELKRHPQLRGRLVVHLVVSEQGRAREVEISDESLRSEAVSSCIAATVKRWVFPIKPDDELPLQFPVLFSPAQ